MRRATDGVDRLDRGHAAGAARVLDARHVNDLSADAEEAAIAGRQSVACVALGIATRERLEPDQVDGDVFVQDAARARSSQQQREREQGDSPHVAPGLS
jgi:hypothetical protein